MSLEVGDGLFVAIESFALAHDLAIPVEPDRSEVTKLRPFVVNTRLAAVKVFHAHQERLTLRARRQPCNHRCSEIADVQVTRW